MFIISELIQKSDHVVISTTQYSGWLECIAFFSQRH